MIKRITLVNCGPFQHAELSDMPDVLAIKGHNGAGKSAILDAVLNACTGVGFPTSCLYVDRMTGKQAKTGEVTVEFDDGAVITMARETGTTDTKWTLSPGKGATIIKLSGVKDPYVKEKVQEISGFVLIEKSILQYVDSANGVAGEAILGETMRPQTALRILNSSTGEGGLDSALRLGRNNLLKVNQLIPSLEQGLAEVRTRREELELSEEWAAIEAAYLKIVKLDKKIEEQKSILRILDKLERLDIEMEIRKEVNKALTEHHAVMVDIDSRIEAASEQAETANSVLEKTGRLSVLKKRLADSKAAMDKVVSSLGITGKNLALCSECGGVKVCLNS